VTGARLENLKLTVRRARIATTSTASVQSAVMVKDLQSGEVTAVEYKPDLR